MEWLAFFFGAVRAGYPVVTLNVRYRQRELDYMLAQSGARVVVSAAEADGFDFIDFYRTFDAPSVSHYFFLGGGEEGQRFADLLGDPGDFAPVAQDPASTAAILYTSGTTGQPKGAVLTNASLLASARAQVEHTDHRPDDHMVSLMPLNHVGGLTCSLTVSLVAGAGLTMMPVFTPTSALEAIERFGATRFGGVPTMWRLMLDVPDFAERNVSTVTQAVIGGSNADSTLCRDIDAGFGGVRLVNLYGLSESSGAAVMSAHSDGIEQVSEHVGVPLGGIEARVVDPAGIDVLPGEIGQLQLRGPSIADGYWQLPDQTAETFGDDGWLNTGDLVVMTEDGHIALRGRSKEMFVQGGYNVYPVEVENLLVSHPQVSMAAGIGVPDPVMGEIGRYFIIRTPDATVSDDELIDFCRGELADYKVPRQVVFVDEMPMTPAGKIAKAQLKER